MKRLCQVVAIFSICTCGLMISAAISGSNFNFEE